MRIGYTLKAGTDKYDLEAGDLIIIVGTDEALLQEYLVHALLHASDDEEAKTPLLEVMQYVQVTHTQETTQ